MQTNRPDWFAVTSSPMRSKVPHPTLSPMRDKVHPYSVRSRARDKVPVKGEPSFVDGSLHERAWRAKSISRSAERDCFLFD